MKSGRGSVGRRGMATQQPMGWRFRRPLGIIPPFKKGEANMDAIARGTASAALTLQSVILQALAYHGASAGVIDSPEANALPSPTSVTNSPHNDDAGLPMTALGRKIG